MTDRGARPPLVPDRYGDAVRARRAELRAARALLLGAHRAELRHCVTASRLAASAELGEALAGLARELRHHVARADRAGRAALPALVGAAVDRLVDRVVVGWGVALLGGLRCVAASRCPPGVPVWPVGAADPVVELVLGRPSVALPGPDPPVGTARLLLAGMTGGTWRLALLPVAVLPAVGLPAWGGLAVLPPALGIGIALLVAAARAQRVAADQVRLRRWADEVVATVRAALDTELARRAIEVERVAAAELDDLVARRLTRVDAELRALT